MVFASGISESIEFTGALPYQVRPRKGPGIPQKPEPSGYELIWRDKGTFTGNQLVLPIERLISPSGIECFGYVEPNPNNWSTGMGFYHPILSKWCHLRNQNTWGFLKPMKTCLKQYAKIYAYIIYENITSGFRQISSKNPSGFDQQGIWMCMYL